MKLDLDLPQITAPRIFRVFTVIPLKTSFIQADGINDICKQKQYYIKKT